MKQIPWLKAAVSEPYRIFFPLGIFWAFWGVSHWLFYALHWIPQYSMQFHSHVQIHAYMGCFITGFLLTAMPRFASARPASMAEFMIFLILVNAAPIFYLRESWIAGRLCFAAWLFALAWFAGRRFIAKKKDSKVQPPVEFVWIPAALLTGLAGTFLLIASDLRWFSSPVNKIAKLFLEQGFLLLVVVGVGSFLGPRLMGTFRPLFKIQDAAAQAKERGKAVFINLAAIIFILGSFIIEGLGYVVPGYGLRTAVIGFIYGRARALAVKPVMREPFVWMLWLSFWMVFFGHAVVLFFPAYRAALLHIAFIGGYGLMAFAVGLMVIFSHGGQTQRLKSHGLTLAFISSLIGISLGLRMAAVYFPEHFFLLLATASASWLFAAGLWLILVSGALFRQVSSEEFERCHEDAKKRVESLRSGKPLQ